MSDQHRIRRVQDRAVERSDRSDAGGVAIIAGGGGGEERRQPLLVLVEPLHPHR